MYINRKIIIAFFPAIFIAGVLSGQTYYTRTRNYPLPRTTIERLEESALNIARQRLAKDKKDARGLLLLNFANHLVPNDREVLLVRGKLKFNVPLKVPKRKNDEKEFLVLLTQSRDHINDSDTAMNRHLLAILNQLIRVFDPQEEDAIIALMEFTDNGVEVDINKLLGVKLEDVTDVKFDPKDSRYAISNMSKTIRIPANIPWTDTWIKVKAGKMISVTAHGTWSMGDEVDFPACNPDGYVAYDIKTLKRWTQGTTAAPQNKKKKTTASSFKSKRSGAPGCLLARIGNKEYYIGSQTTFKAEGSGILYFGPYEWGDYLDNYGSLTLNIKIYD
ncbi:MAG: hypothetical protein PHV82_14390 [Victivallaceae bacterium]|nr:hypothetical protein [Victivallaceae bacterium]